MEFGGAASNIFRMPEISTSRVRAATMGAHDPRPPSLPFGNRAAFARRPARRRAKSHLPRSPAAVRGVRRRPSRRRRGAVRRRGEGEDLRFPRPTRRGTSCGAAGARTPVIRSIWPRARWSCTNSPVGVLRHGASPESAGPGWSSTRSRSRRRCSTWNAKRLFKGRVRPQRARPRRPLPVHDVEDAWEESSCAVATEGRRGPRHDWAGNRPRVRGPGGRWGVRFADLAASEAARRAGSSSSTPTKAHVPNLPSNRRAPAGARRSRRPAGPVRPLHRADALGRARQGRVGSSSRAPRARCWTSISERIRS